MVYEDGTEIDESQADWNSISKARIKTVTLHYDGRYWHLTDKKDYFQKKRASCVPGIPESFRVESRTVGYYEGQSKVMYTVDENTGRMKMEVQEIK